jgi:hypothetical protein
MGAKSQQPKDQDPALCSLKMTISIDALNRAKEVTGMVPAKTTFTSAGLLHYD